MSVNIDPGPMRDRPPEFPPMVPEIPVNKWARFYENVKKGLVIFFRALADAREETRDKSKEFWSWVKRIIELLTKLIPK